MSLFNDPRVKLVINEAFYHRRTAVGIFVGINLVFLVAAVSWPKGYVSATTILVTEKNIIQPLMQGTAATTEVADRARLAREIINGRRVMNQVVDIAGWVKPSATENERQDIIGDLNRRTTISNVGKNLIRIEFRDPDAKRSLKTTQTLGDIFIKESIVAKAAESQSAFEFIDRQTQEYHSKLMEMESKLKDFRIANLDSRVGAEGDIGARMTALQTRIEQSTQELKEAEVKKRSLETQLSGEAESASVLTREGQYRQRLAELNNQLETLRLSYHDSYPDIVRLRHQIEDLKTAVDQERSRRQTARASGQSQIDESVINSPVYLQLKRDMSQNQITIDTLRARINEAHQQLEGVLERGKRDVGGETTLSELTRDYQVTRDIYQDLLRRRENARVSMNMDKENQGLTFRVQEPATLPQAPSGLQFWHFILIGLLAGAAAPIATFYGRTRIDPRLRDAHVLAERYRPPLLVAVPHLWSNSEVAECRHEVEWLLMGVITTVGVMTLVLIVRTVGAFFS